jgi:hypothetical protein
MSNRLFLPPEFPRELTLDQLIGWVVGRGFSSDARTAFKTNVERLNGLVFSTSQYDALFADIEDESAAQALEDELDRVPPPMAPPAAFRLIGNRWEFVGGAAPAPPLTVLKPYGVPAGRPPRAEYPATRTVQPSAPRSAGRPPSAVYP